MKDLIQPMAQVVAKAEAMVAIVGPSGKAEVWTSEDGYVYRAVSFAEYNELVASLNALKMAEKGVKP